MIGCGRIGLVQEAEYVSWSDLTNSKASAFPRALQFVYADGWSDALRLAARITPESLIGPLLQAFLTTEPIHGCLKLSAMSPMLQT
mmetsp:Transcript_49318/g.78015  ORF Transcript_49318/g.78015 Transcript_49318/m.78015 type:complete len:86 (-) Transcript_49318:216-473(-)